jgi:hypothetical protein
MISNPSFPTHTLFVPWRSCSGLIHRRDGSISTLTTLAVWTNYSIRCYFFVRRSYGNIFLLNCISSETLVFASYSLHIRVYSCKSTRRPTCVCLTAEDTTSWIGQLTLQSFFSFAPLGRVSTCECDATYFLIWIN